MLRKGIVRSLGWLNKGFQYLTNAQTKNMRKLNLLVVILLVSVLNSYAQLQDSRWTNVMYIPERTETLLHFKKDTAVLYVAATGLLVETMTYQVNKDSLILTKVSGTSPCSDVRGFYKIEIKEKQLYIKPLNDECGDRANAFVSDPWIRQEGK